MSFVVFAGQSNMGGPYMEAASLTAPWTPDPHILIWNDPAGTWDMMLPGQNTGYAGYANAWGPEVQFALDFHAQFPNEVLRIVKTVAGGTGLAINNGAYVSDWSPQSSGELFDATAATIARASATLHGLMPSAVFFGQGEEDANTAQAAQAYGDNLAAFIAAVRQRWMADPNGHFDFFRITTSPAFAADVRAGELRVDQADPFADSFDTAGFAISGDNLHFAPAGYNAIGDGFFRLYAAQPGAGAEADAGANFVIRIPASGGSFAGTAGADVFGFSQAPWAPAIISGFTPGQDRLDLSAVLQAAGYGGADPVASGVIILQPDGQGGTQILFDRDGPGSNPQFGDYIIRLANVPNAGLTWAQLSGGAGTPSGGGTEGNDVIQGTDGSDYLRGGGGNDWIAGGGAFDDINGNTGADTLSGGNGDDWVVGGKDNDVQAGDAGNDIVWGNLGDDTLDGGEGADQVRGGQGNDSVSGGAGDDYVSGDRGDDTISGGAGADLFHGSQDAGIDRVLDFRQSEGDRVMLDRGTTFSVYIQDHSTIIDMGGGNQMILVGVEPATLTAGWVFTG